MKFPGPTRHSHRLLRVHRTSGYPLKLTVNADVRSSAPKSFGAFSQRRRPRGSWPTIARHARPQVHGSTAHNEHRLNPRSLRASAFRISSAAPSARAVVGHRAAPSVISMASWRRAWAGINTSSRELFGFPQDASSGYPTDVRMDWLRLIRFLTQYVAPGLAAVVVVVEIMGWLFGAPVSPSATYTYHFLLLIVFSLLTAIMIGICGWIVCLWDLDRLFFKLESKIDSQLVALESKSGEGGNDGTLLGRARELLNKIMKGSRAMAVSAIEKSYWIDINAGGALAFPKPAPIVSRLIFMYFAPEIKVRLYRRLLLRFLSQLGALFVLTAICFYISILAWSRVRGSVFFSQAGISPMSIALYQLDLMLRGALFDFMEHTRQSISPIAVNRNATAFLYYTLVFRMFVTIYVMSSLFRVLRFVLRRWRVLLR